MILNKKKFLNRLELAGLSRSEFARRCGLSRQAITAWINGDRNPKQCNVKVMAEALHCKIEDIASSIHGGYNELEKTIVNIKLMAEKLTDINVAKTVESMLKGLIK